MLRKQIHPASLGEQIGLGASPTAGYKAKPERGTVLFWWKKSKRSRAILGGILALRGWKLTDEIKEKAFLDAVKSFLGHSPRRKAVVAPPTDKKPSRSMGNGRTQGKPKPVENKPKPEIK